MTITEQVRQACTPNELISRQDRWVILAALYAVWLLVWWAFRPAIFPSPVDIVQALPSLWNDEGLGQELTSSLLVNWQAVALSVVISLPVGYLSRMPAMAPVSDGIAKMRFVSPAVFFLPLLFLASSGHELKVLMLALGEIFFLVTTVNGIARAVPQDRLDDCRTLRMNEWQVTWYAVVRGTVDQVFDAVRDNAAMGWSMLMMVEGYVRSEGGVGVLILNQQRHMNLAAADAVIFVILGVGWLQDYGFQWVKRLFCPWTVR